MTSAVAGAGNGEGLELPFFEVRFDKGWIGWVLITNDFRLLPKPLLSRCPPIRLRDPSLEDLIGFAQRQGRKRGLSAASIDAACRWTETQRKPAPRPYLAPAWSSHHEGTEHQLR